MQSMELNSLIDRQVPGLPNEICISCKSLAMNLILVISFNAPWFYRNIFDQLNSAYNNH